ncbi:phospholipase B1, membrane-associated-like [Ylistrum balloti]|uniref:phospholipase B1, membrane-associated-like n=1 Tax=Ylistrum balloti TaxID=509963 RepID=UPI0029058A03|nr:phospholipase B1, membrane-associated-like [Ylistrum balloti]
MRSSVLLVFVFSVYVAADFSQYRDFLLKQENNETFLREFDDHMKSWVNRQSVLAARQDFPCEVLEPLSPATSVNKLTPSDIKVVAAIGDSITAGTGIKALTPIGLLTQWRGLSWSVGGDGNFEEEITVPNIIKKYNPDVKGFSVGTGGVHSRNARLNVADPGAKSDEIQAEAEDLLERMRNDPDVDMENDWKLITLFIGGNDLCSYCKDETKYAPEKYVDNIKQTLDILYQHVPRAFVNVVPVLNINVVRELNQNLVCDALHLYLCQCAAYPRNSDEENKMQLAVHAYQQQLTDLVMSGQFEKDDFAVIIQPFFTNTELPKRDGGEPDLAYFAPDCFHLSRDGHQAAATALWNNMLARVDEKDDFWQPGETINCPTKDYRYFATYQNSNSRKGFGQTYQDQGKNEQSSEHSVSSLSTSGLIIGGCLSVLVCLAALAVALFRRNSRNSEKHSLIEQNIKLSYTQI